MLWILCSSRNLLKENTRQLVIRPRKLLYIAQLTDSLDHSADDECFHGGCSATNGTAYLEGNNHRQEKILDIEHAVCLTTVVSRQPNSLTLHAVRTMIGSQR